MPRTTTVKKAPTSTKAIAKNVIVASPKKPVKRSTRTAKKAGNEPSDPPPPKKSTNRSKKVRDDDSDADYNILSESSEKAIAVGTNRDKVSYGKDKSVLLDDVGGSSDSCVEGTSKLSAAKEKLGKLALKMTPRGDEARDGTKAKIAVSTGAKWPGSKFESSNFNNNATTDDEPSNEPSNKKKPNETTVFRSLFGTKMEPGLPNPKAEFDYPAVEAKIEPGLEKRDDDNNPENETIETVQVDEIGTKMEPDSSTVDKGVGTFKVEEAETEPAGLHDLKKPKTAEKEVQTIEFHESLDAGDDNNAPENKGYFCIIL